MLDRAHRSQLCRIAIGDKIACFQPPDAMFGTDRTAKAMHHVMQAGLYNIALRGMVGRAAARHLAERGYGRCRVYEVAGQPLSSEF